MPMRAMLVLVCLLLLGIPVLSAYAADEDLFDTKAAEAAREQGIAALRQRNYDAAIEAFEDAVASSPDAESYYLLGYAYYLKGKTGHAESRTKAAENFGHAYQINPSFTPSRIKPEDIILPEERQETEQSLGAVAPANTQESPSPAAPRSGATTTGN